VSITDFRIICSRGNTIPAASATISHLHTDIWRIDGVQEMDLLLYGDSIFESFLGKQVGQTNAAWADIADVWTKHHGSSKSKVLAISGMCNHVRYSYLCCLHDLKYYIHML